MINDMTVQVQAGVTPATAESAAASAAARSLEGGPVVEGMAEPPGAAATDEGTSVVAACPCRRNHDTVS